MKSEEQLKDGSIGLASITENVELTTTEFNHVVTTLKKIGDKIEAIKPKALKNITKVSERSILLTESPRCCQNSFLLNYPGGSVRIFELAFHLLLLLKNVILFQDSNKHSY